MREKRCYYFWLIVNPTDPTLSWILPKQWKKGRTMQLQFHDDYIKYE